MEGFPRFYFVYRSGLTKGLTHDLKNTSSQLQEYLKLAEQPPPTPCLLSKTISARGQQRVLEYNKSLRLGS
jgi:hypothetical protein